MKVREIKNGRLAMVAFLGFTGQYLATQKSPVDNLLDHLKVRQWIFYIFVLRVCNVNLGRRPTQLVSNSMLWSSASMAGSCRCRPSLYMLRSFHACTGMLCMGVAYLAWQGAEGSLLEVANSLRGLTCSSPCRHLWQTTSPQTESACPSRYADLCSPQKTP